MKETQCSGLQSGSRAAQFSRRQIVSTIAGAATYFGLQPLAGARAAEPIGSNRILQGCSPAPVPIPGGFNGKEAFGPRFPDRFFNFFLPGTGLEPSTISNFNGVVTIQSIQGTGTRTELDPITGEILNQTPNLPFAIPALLRPW
jgi:hypothetical protein